MLSETVKLVGPSINCNDCHKDFSRCREGVHTDGHLIAVDSVGVRILMKHWRRPSSKEQDCEYNESGPIGRRARGELLHHGAADVLARPRLRNPAHAGKVPAAPCPRPAADVGQVDGLVVVRAASGARLISRRSR